MQLTFQLLVMSAPVIVMLLVVHLGQVLPTHGNPVNQRVAIPKEAEKWKLKVEKQKGSKVSKRKKLTSFISDKKSRQEFVPLIGLDRVHIKLLHTKNHACQQLFSKKLFMKALQISSWQISSIV